MKGTIAKPVFNTELLKPGTMIVLKEKNLKPKFNCLVRDCFETDLELVYITPKNQDDVMNVSIDKIRDGECEIEVIRENDFLKIPKLESELEGGN